MRNNSQGRILESWVQTCGWCTCSLLALLAGRTYWRRACERACSVYSKRLLLLERPRRDMDST
jgi:hypothetical protein